VKRMMTAALIGAVMLTGCRQDQADDQMTGSVTPADMQQARSGWAPELSAAVDSGNAAFSAENYDAALEQFREATRIAPNVVAGWFGIYMTEHARGNIAAADSAMARVQQLSPGASLVHPDTGPAAMPPGHPAPTTND
jgi:Flp pilus assembly protein TadD